MSATDPSKPSTPSNGDSPTAAAGLDNQHHTDGRPTPQSEARAMGGRFSAGMPTEKAKDARGAIRRLIRTMGRERAGGIAVVCLAICAVTLSAIGPRILGHATDTVVMGAFSPAGVDFGRLRHYLFIAMGLYVTSAVLQFTQNWLLAGVVQRSMQRLRSEVEAKLHRVPLRYVDTTPRGDLLSRVTNDIDNLAQSLQQTLSQLLTSLLTLVAVLAMMFSISVILGFVAAILIPTSIFVTKFIAARSKKRFIAQWMHTGTLNAQVEEAFTGHSLVKVFGQTAEVERLFDEKNDELFKASFGAQFIAGIIPPAMMFLGNLNFVAVAVIGGLQVSSGRMSIGDIQAFIQYSRQFTQPLTQVASITNVLQSGIASAERVFELLDAVEESADPPATADQGPTRGRVEFEDVSFSYLPDRPLITDLSLKVEPGQTVAIVGPTGAGKTTLVNLIMRFYDIDSGRITLDGRDTAEMSRRELRSQIGMVLQDTWLFGGTIRENIAFGNPSATEDEIRTAARATYVDRFVHSLPDGYDTLVDDEGGTVSAGEKQLLTIARAFLADPAILILDEATSSVDTRTEVLIQHAMAALRAQRTSFVIAHRLSTIRDADTILVMEDGRIVE
ncbi:MAG: ABC transporter ATP-binding protein, partial [Acidimicrobiales bacterium]|nr:ABC transporter ATP-binding protein [Acidimicrobiales bacterium]